MDPRLLIDGAILYLGLLVVLTFRGFGHARMAWRRGNDTALSQGRVSLNPLVHIDPIGTVALLLLMIIATPGGFFAGGVKPVPVNPYNLRRWPSSEMHWPLGNFDLDVRAWPGCDEPMLADFSCLSRVLRPQFS